jgi:hypothetical protein
MKRVGKDETGGSLGAVQGTVAAVDWKLMRSPKKTLQPRFKAGTFQVPRAPPIQTVLFDY